MIADTATSAHSAPPASPASAHAPAPRVVPARYWGQWIAAVVLLVFVLGFVGLIASSKNVQWSAIPRYLFDPTILDGIRLTLVFTVLSMLISTVAGVVLATLRMAHNPVLSGFSHLYIWFFRGTPLLVQIIFWFNIQLFIPSLGIGSFHVETNTLISAFTAALLALSLNEAAYMAEIVRGGLLAVDKGQAEAATALGYTPFQTLTRIVLPQALRVIVPPVGNQTISMLKTTSLVSVVAAQDLLTRVQNIYATNFLIIELLLVASIWYLVMTTVASLLQSWLERRLGQSVSEPPLVMRLMRNLMSAVGSKG
ncbi:amino acid ABC transporter membrane protein, PAAT family [Faunimonas pinastri]|uniref:Glutamate/aspartate import permease protein GltK n=1 Tax=Faunimonas pinastri TaxID=1855383 RepID=A0A1H9CL42_9HYPH|nr:amino acid ABC transporter permease [Faunimonas pinastri]SEQ01932.1 amino acid ABC transporter membrane protein, PAAT family [Faunimonas pinastri]